jgi:hypothetical protein
MPRFRFVEHEYAKCIVDFDADSLEHAQELMESVMDADELPNSTRYWKNGDTTWDNPEEVSDEEDA